LQYDDMHDAYVETGLGRLHFKEHDAAGPCVLFVHGLAASTLSFKRLVAELPDAMHVILLDMLGHGLSDAPRIEYSLDAQLRAVHEFIAQRGIAPCYVFGHSYGALVAASLAHEHATDVKGLVLEDPAGLGERDMDSAALDAYEERLVRAALELNPREYVVRSMVHSAVRGPNEIARMLHGISLPVMVIWGSDDREFVGSGDAPGIDYARRLSEGINGGRFELIQGAGHVPHFTHAREICRLLAGFVA
jgi:pimeloyl-ACP methyl ester carboxylesterase